MTTAGIPCPQCGETMLLLHCCDCDGFGGWWEPAPEPDGNRWQVCSTCHDTGQRWVCLNTFGCPGKRWYPLDARCAGMLAAAKEGSGNG